MISIMGDGIALSSCFVVLSALTFAEGSIRMDFRRDEASKSFQAKDIGAGNSIKVRSNVRVDRSTDSGTKLLEPKGSFLAGEDTPVWIAYYADPNNKIVLSYRLLEKGIVKEAIDYWKSNEFKGIAREKRSYDQNMHLLKIYREHFGKREVTNNSHASGSYLDIRKKRQSNTTVYHPSVLAIMEYGKTWPTDEKDERTLFLERILYALAYWNDVNLQLRYTENPRVRLRLAGIVIGRDRDAINHVDEFSFGQAWLHYEGTLSRMVEYWGVRMRQKIDFQRGTYNIVALMTDEKPAPPNGTAAVSTDGLPCNHDKPEATGVLITYDNLEFSGLQETVHHTARILGHGSVSYPACPYENDRISRTWSTCDLYSIQKSLYSNGWCMKEPQEFHNPGKPVETILPGMITALEGQCKPFKWNSGNNPEWLKCDALCCRQRYLTGCVHWHAPMDGDECGIGMICLNTVCVSNTTLTYA